MDTQKQHLLDDDANRNFYKHVRNFNKVEKPKQFDVRILLPGRRDIEVAEHLATYFNQVSNEFEPLFPDEIPITKPRSLPVLQVHEVSSRIRCFRKHKSMVPVDVFPTLVTDMSDFFTMPLMDIYNEISRTLIWPRCWKKEFVTIIPKKAIRTA